MRVKVRQLTEKHGFHFALPVADRMTGFEFDGQSRGGHCTGLITVNGKHASALPGSLRDKQVRDSDQHELEVAVRLDGANAKITTTLDSRAQEAANRAIRGALLAYDRRHGWRGPEGHVDLADGATPADWQQALHDYRSLAGLQPALVTEVTDADATLYLADGQSATQTVEQMKWAAPYTSADRRGAAPRKVADVLKVGDIVRMTRGEEGEWMLAQIPQAQGALAADSRTTGRTRLPTLTLHAIDDPTAFVELEGVYRAQREAAGTADQLVQVFSSEREHSYLSDTEYVALFDELLGWIDRGAKPTPQSVALRCDTLKARFDTDSKNGCHLRPAWQPERLESRVPARLPH